MAITLQVRDVREEIYRSAGAWESAGKGAASTMTLGRLFHEIFAGLVGPDPKKNFIEALELAEASQEEWRRALIEHTYQCLAGPGLRRLQSELKFLPDQTLTFWDAVQELCHWLTGLLWKAQAENVDLKQATITTEESLRWELNDPEWTDSVVLTGVADAVWRINEKQRWCLIELKTGRAAPEADLAQACLYHQMLIASGMNPSGALAVMSFGPRIEEKLFSADQIVEAQWKLRDLIARLAGVIKTDEEPSVKSEAPIHPPMEDDPATEEHLALGQQLTAAFAEFGVVITAHPPIVGPTFLRYPIELGKRVSIKSVAQHAQNVQVRLGLEAPPMTSLEGGRLAIDLQRPDRRLILFSQIRGQLPAHQAPAGAASVPLGVDLNGRLHLADFSQPENAHLLAAGTPGSGKSEWLRSAIAGLILTNTPETLRLALVDPKMNAFQLLKDSPFLYDEIAHDEEAATRLFERLVAEMETRYEQMAQINADHLADYIHRTGDRLPRIFLICDEYADLMMGERKKRQRMESKIRKLGQKARAAGIHLILATQQPSSQVLTGPIKSIITARVGLRMPTVQSRMLLESAGTEALLGKGDLLYKCIGDPVRLQSPYLPPEELSAVFGSRG